MKAGRMTSSLPTLQGINRIEQNRNDKGYNFGLTVHVKRNNLYSKRDTPVIDHTYNHCTIVFEPIIISEEFYIKLIQ